VPLVIFRDEVWRLDIGGHLPRVVLSAETLPEISGRGYLFLTVMELRAW